MKDEAIRAVLTKICTTSLHINPLYIALYQDGVLIKTNTGHEYFIDSLKINSEEELKQRLTDIYYQHKANNTH